MFLTQTDLRKFKHKIKSDMVITTCSIFIRKSEQYEGHEAQREL